MKEYGIGLNGEIFLTKKEMIWHSSTIKKERYLN